MDLGMNLTPVDYWSPQFPWRNIMKQAEEWRSQNAFWVPDGENAWDTGFAAAIPKDQFGYPLELPCNIPTAEAPQIVSTLMARDLVSYDGGEFVCLYDGDGDLEFSFDAQVVSSVPGQINLNINPSSNGIQLRIVRSTKGNHVRNIRVMRTDDVGSGEKYRTSFVNFIKPQYRVTRFMQWQRINGADKAVGSLVVTPGNHIPEDYYTQTSVYGVSAAEIVGVCQATDSSPWVCLPHLANNNYVRLLARYIAENLDAESYRFELSNEVWNSDFAQSKAARTFGLALGLSDDPFTAQARMYGYRFQQVSQIVRDEFEKAGKLDKLIMVMGGQAVNTYFLEQALGQSEAHAFCDELTIAPYFGVPLGSDLELSLSLGVEGVLDFCEDEILNKVPGWCSSHKLLANQYSLGLSAYEAGQHLVGVGGNLWNQQLSDLFIAANRDPRMRDLYLLYLNELSQHMGLTCLFESIVQPSQWGSWGLVESQAPATWPLSYKYQGVKEFLSE